MRLFALLALGLVVSGSTPQLLGRSLRGRPIVAYELGDAAAARKVLVVGCIHGNECAGIAILDRLERLGPVAGTDLWLVPDANPDGHAAGTRGNARGVDLNRNFPTAGGSSAVSTTQALSPRPSARPGSRCG